MITEDYVSFETAKLLKEKGFEGENRDWYNMEGFIEEVGVDDGIAPTAHEDIFNNIIPAPTLQMAMKWLREVHNIAINIGWGEIFVEDYRWWCIILNQKSDEILRDSEYYKTYEEACEAAIKYCLENLI